MADEGNIVISRKLFKSKAWRELKPNAKALLIELFLRRQMRRVKIAGNNPGKRWSCINNGHIIFTYKEANKILSWSSPKFLRYRDELIEKGFLDIANPGGYFEGHPATYIVPGCDGDKINADRWKKYGTDAFISVIREPDKRAFKGQGFRTYWRRKKGKTDKVKHIERPRRAIKLQNQ